MSVKTPPASYARTSVADAEKIRVVLVGDSTMANRTGYGDALCARFVVGVECWNLARGGRSTKSFRVEGLWDDMRARLRDAAPRTTYVLVQFGHNDQPGKAERSTNLVLEYPANLALYVDEVRALGAIPVLVTPLTRRVFKDGVLQDDLRPWAEATLRVAREKQVAALDLHAQSQTLVAAMGTTEADTLAEEPPPRGELPSGVKSRFDHTHLGAKGAALFSDTLSKEIVGKVPALAVFLRS